MGNQAIESDCSSPIINDCWSKIGIRGDGSCAELKQRVHCRNCPTYFAAASTLLDRDLPAKHLAEWTAHFAQPKTLDEPDTHSALIFRIASEWFALSTLALDEVAEPRTIHSLPHVRNGIVLGIVNVRGELLICVSLAKLLRLEETTSPAIEHKGLNTRRLIVLRHKGERMAFPVEEIRSIHRYHPRELKPVPATIAKASVPYTDAMLVLNDKIVGRLDEPRIFHALEKSVA